MSSRFSDVPSGSGYTVETVTDSSTAIHWDSKTTGTMLHPDCDTSSRSTGSRSRVASAKTRPGDSRSGSGSVPHSSSKSRVESGSRLVTDDEYEEFMKFKEMKARAATATGTATRDKAAESALREYARARVAESFTVSDSHIRSASESKSAADPDASRISKARESRSRTSGSSVSRPSSATSAPGSTSSHGTRGIDRAAELEGRKHELDLALDRRRQEIKEAFRAMKLSQCVDLVFLMDCTGSMSSYITECKNGVIEIAHKIKTKFPSLDMRVAFVGYRDHGDGSDRLSIFPFTDKLSDLVRFLGGVGAKGGADGPEDVFGGLEAVLKQLTWKHPTRVLFHVGDAPCHGRDYHSMSDDYPSGDPRGLTHAALLSGLAKASVAYFFCKLNNSTDKMIQVFNQYCREKNIEPVKIQELTHVSALIHTVASSVIASISTTTAIACKEVERKYDAIEEGDEEDSDASTGTSDGSDSSHSSDSSSGRLDRKTRKLKTYKIVKEIPDLHALKPRAATISTFDIKKLKPEQMWGTENLPKHNRAGLFKMAPHPFAEGAERLAYMALDVSYSEDDSPSSSSASRSSVSRVSGEPVRVVMKEFKFRGRGWNKFSRYLGHMEIQSVAAKLAFEFGERVKGYSNTLKFVKAKVVTFESIDRRTGKKSHQYYALEPYVSGSYVRYSNNFGYTSDEHYNASLDAFSHFTYEYSKGNLMVVDLQGVNNLLTDPAIHCTNILRFGRTNFGKPGMKKFFETHTCNHVCKHLELTPRTPGSM